MAEVQQAAAPSRHERSISLSSQPSLSGRQQSTVMTVEEVEETLKSAGISKTDKKVFTREQLMSIARSTDTSRLPSELDMSKHRKLQDGFGQDRNEGWQAALTNGLGLGTNTSASTGVATTIKPWVPNKDAPVFRSQRYPNPSQEYWSGGPQWMNDYNANGQSWQTQAAANQVEQERQAMQAQNRHNQQDMNRQQSAGYSTYQSYGTQYYQQPTQDGFSFPQQFATGPQKQMDVNTLLGHMKSGTMNGQLDPNNMSIEELLKTVKSKGGPGAKVIGGSTLEEIERSMMHGNQGASAQYLLSLLHTAHGGNLSQPGEPSSSSQTSGKGQDINRIMDAFLQQSKSGSSSKEAERRTVSHTSQRPSTGNSALDVLLQGGSAQAQRPFVHHGNSLPNTEGRMYLAQQPPDRVVRSQQLQAHNLNINPNPKPHPTMQSTSTHRNLPPNQNNLDTLLKILQGQQQQQSHLQGGPNLQQYVLQQHLNSQANQMGVAMRPGNVVTGQRPPYIGANRGGQQQQHHPNYSSASVPQSGNFAVQRRVGSSNPSSVTAQPPRSISGGRDNDMIQKLLSMNKATSANGTQRRTRVVSG